MSQSETFAWQALAAHFGGDWLHAIASSRRRFAAHLRPDLQAAIVDEVGPLAPDLRGVHHDYEFQPLTISKLTIGGDDAVALTPLQYQDIDIGEAEPFAVLATGLWLLKTDGAPVAVLLSQYNDHFGNMSLAQVEIAYLPGAAAGAFAARFLRRVQAAGETSKLYRGKVLSFESGSEYSGMRADMLVHRLPTVDRDDVILDAATMARLDRHVFEFDRHRARLKALGQSTRKGILLHGPPGNGKTHVIRYIASTLAERTTVLITAEQVKNLTRYMSLARTLQPSIVVLEDVDLVGRSREAQNSPGTEVLLNRLLNEMDGLKDDADVLFILTTNRPEEIEEALASRPGRIDEAIEVPAPDAACRERLVALYGRALDFADGAVAEIVARSEGASAAFMKEMVRRLAQRSLARDEGARVTREDVAAVLGDAAFETSRIGRRIVGARASGPGDECC